MIRQLIKNKNKMKVVTLKKFPFANENSVVNIPSYTQLGSNIRFKSGKFSYSLTLDKDIRAFSPATDSSLPVALLPKSTGSFTSDLGSFSLMAFLFYRGYKQDKGIGYYIGYGILGWMGGGIAGRMLGNLFSNNYTEAGSQTSSTKTKPTNTTASPSLNNAFITTASNKLSELAKKSGNNISGGEIKSKVLEVSKGYTPIQKDILASLLGLMSSMEVASDKKDAQAIFYKMTEVFEPLSKKYSQSDLELATEKVMGDFEKILPKDLFFKKA
jgi:hypothetical protein